MVKGISANASNGNTFGGSSIPEPATATGLLVIGAGVGLIFLRRKRKTK